MAKMNKGFAAFLAKKKGSKTTSSKKSTKMKGKTCPTCGHKC